jgi:nucleotide-binding universal stress UspA family protein
MFQRLLVCTDLKDGLQRLVNFVPSLAAGGVRHITFLHVIALPEGREIPRIDEEKTKQVCDRLTPAQDQIPQGVDVQVEVQWGRSTERILSVTKTYQPDLIVLGGPSRSLLTEKIIGSTTTDLCQRARTSVLIFRPQLLSTYTHEELELRCRHLFRHLLIPYDGSDTADYLVEQVKSLAQNRPPESLQQCFLSWVTDKEGRLGVLKSDRAEKAKARIAAVKADLEALGLEVKAEIVSGEPVPQILMSAQEHDISAIATASGTLGKLLEWSTPSFTGEVLRRSWHPVLYFPPVN